MATLTRTMTYAELVAAITAGTLNKGESITISDFRTTHIIPYTSDVNYGDIEPITVSAISSNKLRPEAYSTLYPKDIIFYSHANNQNLMPGCTTGFIYRRIDTIYNIDICYDFRAVRFRRYAISNAVWTPGTYNAGTIRRIEGVGVFAAHKTTNNEPTQANSGWIKCISFDLSEYWGPHTYSIQGVTFNPNDFIDVFTFNDTTDPDNSSGYVMGYQAVRNWKIEGVNAGEETLTYWSFRNLLLNNVIHIGGDTEDIMSFYSDVQFYSRYVPIEADMPVMDNTFGNCSHSILYGTTKSNMIGKLFDVNKLDSHMSSINENCILQLAQTGITLGQITGNYIKYLLNTAIVNGGISGNFVESISAVVVFGSLSGGFSEFVAGGTIQIGGSTSAMASALKEHLKNTYIGWEILAGGIFNKSLLRYFDRAQMKFRLFHVDTGVEIL